MLPIYSPDSHAAYQDWSLSVQKLVKGFIVTDANPTASGGNGGALWPIREDATAKHLALAVHMDVPSIRGLRMTPDV